MNDQYQETIIRAMIHYIIELEQRIQDLKVRNKTLVTTLKDYSESGV